MINNLIRYFKDEPCEFILNIAKDVDNDVWEISDGYSFGPWLSSPDEKLVLHETFETFSMYKYMQLYYSNPGHRNQDIFLNYNEQKLLWNAAHNALGRYKANLRKQAYDYITNLVEDFDETRI